jgi:hypothetical protein
MFETSETNTARHHSAIKANYLWHLTVEITLNYGKMLTEEEEEGFFK